jgi:hypothetical protein
MKFICLLIFISVTYDSFSQQLIDVSIKTGLNLPNTYSDIPDLSKLNPENKKITAVIGIFGIYKINKWFGIKTEVFYEERGWVIPNSSALDTVRLVIVPTKKDLFYSFITIPILVQFSVGDKFQAFLNTGMNISRRIGGKIKTNTPNTIGSATSVVQPSILEPKFDIGAVISLGIQIPVFESFSMMSEGRYYRSFSGIGPHPAEQEVKHHGFIFSAGIGYTFGKK